jgi:amino acid transporter/nucleotide-binding universal stress UspA family protein
MEEKPAENQPEQVALARTLGPSSITMMGIGCLIGGGIFTLLGPAAGLAGPGLFIAMLVGSAVAFLNLQMYLALGTTFPEAGGGYLWVRKGLGNFQGFLAGWFSWFAHAAACGVYALSLAFYAREILNFFGAADFGLSPAAIQKVLAVVVVVFFGYLNWRGSKSMGSAGNVITGSLLAILGLFIISGLFRMFSHPAPLANFSPLLPNGVFGIFAAVSFFYIAFEGSEIQVQAGEETKNPVHDLRIGLLVSWGVVSLLYLLISLVTIGATSADGGAAWRIFSSFGEGAIVRAAQGFMPFGRLLMTLAGFLANLAALNATIFSSSHVSFALARDNNIWSGLARIHRRNLTPDLAVMASTFLVAAMVVVLPLLDVAAAASLLFVLLFLQLNLAGINIHFKFPDTKWKYRVPFFPAVPLTAVVIYVLLALTMLRINVTAWLVTAIWLLLGLVNYFAYATTKGRERFENEIVYEEAVHIGPKTGKRILLPISPKSPLEEIKKLTKISLALASRSGGEIIFLKVHEVPQPLTLFEGAVMEHDRQIFENIKGWVEEFNEKMPGVAKDVNLHNLIMIGRDITEVILEVTKVEDCDLLVLNWEGYTQTKGVVFGGKIDRILREAHCDLLVVKDPKPVKSMLVAANPKAKNPNLPLVGELVKALSDYYKPSTELFCVLGEEVPIYFKTDPRQLLEKMGLAKTDFGAIKFKSNRSIVKAVIGEAEAVNADLVIIGSAKSKLLKDIRFGGISESLAKHLDRSLFIVKAHRGITEDFWNRLKKIFMRSPAEREGASDTVEPPHAP